MSSDSGSSSASDGLSDIARSYNSKLSSVSTQAVLIQLALMISLSAGTLVAFSLLRPVHKVVYMPRYKYSADAKRPPKIDDGFLSWVRPLIAVKQDELVDKIGLDAVIFLLFLRMLRWMCTWIAVLTCGLLIPVNLIYNLKHVNGRRAFFSELAITNVRGDWLYVHVATSYVICGIVYFFILKYYQRVISLRWQWFRSQEYQDALYARSLLLTHIPKKGQSDEGLQALLDSLKIPFPVTACHIGRRVAELPELIERHNDAVRELEAVLTTYLKDGKIASKRPTLRVGGTACFGGRKVDAIDYFSDKIKKLESRIQLTRESISDRKPENYGFASFSSAPAAHIVAKQLSHKRIKGVAIELAPQPQDILWENLIKSDATIRRQQITGSIIVGVVTAAWIIPLVAVSLLANLASVTQYVTFLDNWSNNSSFTFSAVVGIAPPVLSTVLQLALPSIFRALTRRSGATTKGKLDRAVLARYFFFLFITQFIILTLLGVVFSTIAEVVVEVGKNESLGDILRKLQKLPDTIQTTYISQSNYWLSWYPTRAFASVFDLAQIIGLLFVSLRTKIWGRTPREIRDWTKPGEFDYAAYSANMLLMWLVAVVYSPLAPLVPLLAAVAFFCSSFIYKYQLMYICVTRTESGGRLWRLMINRVLFCTVIMNAFMCLTIGLQRGWMNSIWTVPPVLFTLGFKIYLKRRFDERFKWYIPNQAEMETVRQHHADARKDRLVKRFGHPSLHAELFQPMLHSASARLLPHVYSGRVENSQHIVNDHKVQGHNIDGLSFAAIAQHDLQYSTAAYLRERDDDEMSMASTAVLGPSGPSQKGNDIALARAAYLERGPGPYNGRATPDFQENIELSRIPSKYSMSSQDNLLGQQPYMHTSLHRPSASQSSNDMGMYREPMVDPRTGQFARPGSQLSNYGPNNPAHGRASPAPSYSGPYYQNVDQQDAYAASSYPNHVPGYGSHRTQGSHGR